VAFNNFVKHSIPMRYVAIYFAVLYFPDDERASWPFNISFLMSRRVLWRLTFHLNYERVLYFFVKGGRGKRLTPREGLMVTSLLI